MRLHQLLLAILGGLTLLACNGTVDTRTLVPCGDGGLCYEVIPPYSGLATLHPHTTDADYLDSVISFEHAATLDSGEVRNDWDLSLDSAELRFRVNTVTDDRSWIVDLGPISVENVPETVDLADFAPGPYGDHDFAPAALEHVYLVRTEDTETRQYAAFRVIDLAPDVGVTLQWFRSKDPERFVFPRGELL